MGLADLAVVSTLAVVAAWPFLRTGVASLGSFFTKPKADSPDSVEAWRQKWTYFLITLGREIEAGEGDISNRQQALMLSKELMWEIIGGDSPAPKAGP